MSRSVGENLGTTSGAPLNHRKIDWPVTLFLVILPIVAVLSSCVYLYYCDITAPIIIFTLVFAALTNLSITAGYHRMYAHRSYEAHLFVKLIYLFIGTSAWQGSVLRWAKGHRRHHSFEDTDKDPYSIGKGFWFAHMGWMFLQDPDTLNHHAPDLDSDPLLKFQDRHYVVIAWVTSFGFPMLVGYFLGDALAGLIFGGFLRVFLTQQSTYFINSLCHYWGKKPYASVTARDSILMAFLTHGEGYHNFHHRFQNDYRNGYRWYHWDPTKWTIRLLSLVGLAKKLKRISQQEIFKARLQMEEVRLRSIGFSHETLSHMKERILAAQNQLKNLRLEYQQIKNQFSASSQEKLNLMKLEIASAKLEFKKSLKQWESYRRCRQQIG